MNYSNHKNASPIDCIFQLKKSLAKEWDDIRFLNELHQVAASSFVKEVKDQPLMKHTKPINLTKDVINKQQNVSLENLKCSKSEETKMLEEPEKAESVVISVVKKDCSSNDQIDIIICDSNYEETARHLKSAHRINQQLARLQKNIGSVYGRCDDIFKDMEKTNDLVYSLGVPKIESDCTDPFSYVYDEKVLANLNLDELDALLEFENGSQNEN